MGNFSIELMKYKVMYHSIFGKVTFPDFHTAIDEMQKAYGEVAIADEVNQFETFTRIGVDENAFTAICAFVYEGIPFHEAMQLFCHVCLSCGFQRPMLSFLADDALCPRCAWCRRCEKVKIIPPLTYFICSLTASTIAEASSKINELHSIQFTSSKECAMSLEVIYEIHVERAFSAQSTNKLFISDEEILKREIESAEGYRYELNGREKIEFPSDVHKEQDTWGSGSTDAMKLLYQRELKEAFETLTVAALLQSQKLRMIQCELFLDTASFMNIAQIDLFSKMSI